MPSRKKIISFILFILLYPNNSCGPKSTNKKIPLINPARKKKIEEEIKTLSQWLTKNADTEAVPFFAMAIVSSDSVIFKKTITSSSKQKYTIASFTKSFTALAALRLAEKGYLKLDDPVSKYLPVKLKKKKSAQRL